MTRSKSASDSGRGRPEKAPGATPSQPRRRARAGPRRHIRPRRARRWWPGTRAVRESRPPVGTPRGDRGGDSPGAEPRTLPVDGADGRRRASRCDGEGIAALSGDELAHVQLHRGPALARCPRVHRSTARDSGRPVGDALPPKMLSAASPRLPARVISTDALSDHVLRGRPTTSKTSSTPVSGAPPTRTSATSSPFPWDVDPPRCSRRRARGCPGQPRPASGGSHPSARPATAPAASRSRGGAARAGALRPAPRRRSTGSRRACEDSATRLSGPPVPAQATPPTRPHRPRPAQEEALAPEGEVGDRAQPSAPIRCIK
jgi:hypothetical protein